MSSRNALIVFAKRPVPGAVKTRLTTVLTREDAARLYEAFLRDALLQYTTLDADVRLYLGPPDGPLPPGLVPPGVSLHQQQGADLGARMPHAFVESFAAGYQRLVVIGTDHPTLPTAFVEAAFAALEPAPAVCIGPSDDGGYYLLGMNDFFPQLFDGMHYSHDGVFAQTLARAGLTRANVTILPPWYDVDTPEALRRLVEDLHGASVEAAHTRRAVAALQAKHPALRAGSLPS